MTMQRTVLRQAFAAMLGCLTAGLAAPAAAQPATPSFDCAKASTSVERLLCEDHGLARQDRMMAAVYKRALERADGAEVDRIRADQRAWAGGRALACPETAPDRVGCLADIYEARLDELRPLSFDDLALYDEVNVQEDRRAPLACLRFSEPLSARQPAALESYVESAGGEPLAAHVVDNELCVQGLAHGGRHSLTVHAGLRGEGAILREDRTVAFDIPDRPRRVAFPSDGVILPRLDAAGVPIESVNVESVRVLLLRIDDRDVVEGLKRGVIENPLGYGEVGRIASKLGQNVWTGEIAIDAPRNESARTAIPVAELVPDLQPGVYLAVAEDPEADYAEGWQTAAQWFVVSDIGLSTFIGQDGLTVVARQLGSAAPAAGARIALKAEGGATLAEATTDAAGVARISAGFLRGEDDNRPRAVYAYGASGDFVYVDVTRAPLDLSDRGVDGRTPPGPLDAYLTADRGVYRPGGVVRLTALLRDGEARAVEGLPLTLSVVRPDGLEAYRATLQDKGAGGYSAELPLPPTAATGQWRATLSAGADTGPVGRVAFLVEDFVPPRLEMTLEAATDGDAVTASVGVDYLYGAPGAGLPGEVIVDVQRAETPVPDHPGYSFGRAEDTSPEPYRAGQERFVVGDDGRATARVALPERFSGGFPLEAVVRASVFDTGGRPASERAVVPLGNLPLMIGLKSAFERGDAPAFDLMAFASDGTPVARRLEYAIVREEREYVWFRVGDRWDYRVEYYETETVSAGDIDTDAAGPVRISQNFDAWGAYRLEVSDEQTGVATSLRFHAGPWGAQAAGEDDAPDKVKVTLPPGPFRPGETVTARIEPPFDAEVVVAVADSGIGPIQSARIPASGGDVTLTLPEKGAAGAYVLASAFAAAPGDHSLAPRRAIGAAWAGFDSAPRTLAVGMTAPATTEPERTVDVRLDLGRTDGRAYVTLAAIDDGVLALTGYTPPDPAGHFLAKRRLGVDIRDVYGRFIDAAGAAIGRVRSGGGARMAMMEMQKAAAADLPQKSVRVVALFSGIVEAGPDGTAVVPIDVPEFSGRLRLMAQAWTAGKVGAAETTMLVRRPVVATLALPRFLAPGDHAMATVSLRNLNGPEGDYRATLTATGAVATATDAALGATLAPGDAAAAARFQLSGLEPGDAALSLAVEGPGGMRFRIDRVLSVRPPAPQETRSVKVAVAPGAAFEPPLGLLDDVYTATAQVIVGLNPLPDMDLPSVLASLARYPYGCAEQTTSTSTPLLYAQDLARSMGAPGADDPAAAIAAGVERLLGMQTYSGGFGFWNADYEAAPWISVYATDFLVQARGLGYAVPEPALTRALSRLAQIVDQGGRFDRDRIAGAYALYVRARAGVADPARVRRFADSLAIDRHPPLGFNFAAAALAAVGDRSGAQRLFARALTAAQPEEETRYWHYGSELRDLAAGLTLMAESRALPWPDLEARAEELASLIRERQWLSTQEKAWIVRAASALGDAAEAGGFAVSVDGGRVDDVGAGLYRAAAGGARLPRLVNLGQEPVTGVISVLGALRTPAPPVDSGFAIERAFYSQTGDRIRPEDIRQNDLVVVLLSGRQTADGQARALLVDYLPAGLELENARLGGEELGAYGWLGQLTSTEHVELRDDRYVAAFESAGGQSFRLAYLARAVTPGEFVQGGARIEAMYRPEQFGRAAAATIKVGGR